ncbi:MAG: DUF748 domain-containing protein [Candidatus Omnitrophota bacterium]
MLKKIILIFLILVVLVYLGLFIFIGSKGKALLCKNLSQVIGKEVKITSLYLVPPYSILINNLEIVDFLSVEKVKIEPSIIGLFLKKVGLNKLFISQPNIFIVRDEAAKFNFDEIVDHIKLKDTRIKQQKKKLNFFIKEAILEGGTVLFQDKKAKVSFTIDQLNSSAITSLRDLKTKINLEGKAISNNKVLGEIFLNGWLNLLRKDMEARLYLSDVELVHFLPYFKSFFKNIKSGKLFFSADMFSKNNDLAIDCHLETRDLKFSEETLIVDAEDKKITFFGNIPGLLLDTITGTEKGGIFDFSIHTKFDSPKFEGLQFKGTLFKESIKNILQKGPEQTKEAIKKIGKDFEKIGKEFKGQLEDMGDLFKKQAEKTQSQADSQAQEILEGALDPESAQ